MAISISSFGDDAPSGENLEYDPLFTALQLAAQPEEERQAGNEILPGAEPSPKPIVEAAQKVLEQSHDLRAAVLYGYGAVRIHGLPGLAEATAYIRTCLTEFWDTCHPQLDADDDDDPTERVNAVLGLADPQTVLKAVRNAPLTESRSFGRMSLRDIAIAEGEASPPADMENVPTAQSVGAAFQDTDPETLKATRDAARQALEDVLAINAVFDAKTPGQGPSLDPLVTLLKRATARLTEEVGEEAAPAAEDGAEAAPVAAGPAGAGAAAARPSGAIASRKDVEQAIDRILKYYEEQEPSSPLPLLLKRARRLVGADFMTIVNDLAPLGVENVNLIGGMENPE
ncbi:type VI secretion system protein TssA [Oceaniglobus roseus]|uniref:type VI secretion system protein TssA n=1 Tax=Oceaniglobus roseus TaxID=1737570 RepID=UPI000C7EAC36|nr:type VI secretion system protein TssA [Kandeliimicrobium roseum]